MGLKPEAITLLNSLKFVRKFQKKQKVNHIMSKLSTEPPGIMPWQIKDYGSLLKNIMKNGYLYISRGQLGTPVSLESKELSSEK